MNDRTTNDSTILNHIGELVAEEHRLELAHGDGPLDATQSARLRTIEISLDQSWDLLRQRRARRDAGLDADQASTRPAGTVETYTQ